MCTKKKKKKKKKYPYDKTRFALKKFLLAIKRNEYGFKFGNFFSVRI